MSVVGLPFSPQKRYTGGATEIESEPGLRRKKKTDNLRSRLQKLAETGWILWHVKGYQDTHKF